MASDSTDQSWTDVASSGKDLQNTAKTTAVTDNMLASIQMGMVLSF